MLKKLFNFRNRLTGAFWKDRFISTTTALSFLVNAGSWFALWKITAPRQEFIPIHYSISIGIDRVGPWTELFLMPAVGTGVLILNTLFAWLATKESRLARVLVTGTLLIQVTVAVSIGFLIIQFL